MAQILLAEDDDSMRLFLSRALERAGHDVHAVGDGVSAATALAGSRFDLLVADIVMPGMDGIELARRAGADYPNLRIMLITGFAALVLQARQSAPSRARVFTKPIHLRDLVNQVDESVEHQQRALTLDAGQQVRTLEKLEQIEGAARRIKRALDRRR